MEMGEGESVELQRWRMVCDVDVDVGRSLGLKRGESRWRNRRRKREKRTEVANSGERNFGGKKGWNKIFFFFFIILLQYNSKVKILL